MKLYFTYQLPLTFMYHISARYMVRNADWGVISASSGIYHQAFGTVVSFADGPIGGSTGTPYFYIAEMSTTWKVI